MKQIQLTITAEEIKSKASAVISSQQIDDISSMVENDEGLWNDIDKSIQQAVRCVVSEQV